MTQKPKLSVGDRVRVYGPVFCSKVWDVLTSDEPRVGTITKIGNRGSGGGVFFKDEGRGDEFWAYSQQVRKLRPKQKPEKERERKTWHVGSFSQTEDGSTTGTLFPNGHVRPPWFGTDLVAIEPGQVVLGREELEKAIDQIPLSMSSCERYKQITEPLCKRFGLGKDKA